LKSFAYQNSKSQLNKPLEIEMHLEDILDLKIGKIDLTDKKQVRIVGESDTKRKISNSKREKYI